MLGLIIDCRSMITPPQTGHVSQTDLLRLSSPGRQPGIRLTLAVLCLFLAVTVLLQWLSGTYQSDFGGYADEPSHFVTGLMVRDYIATGFHGRPLQYAENYYLHYPKVALGHWPPVFYLMQAAWTLVFSASHASVLLLMAAITAALALILFREITYRFNAIYGIAGGLLLICLPVTQDVTSMIMADSPVGLFSFLAIIRLARFLDDDRWQDGCWYGLWCCAAILSKGNGWAAPFAMPVAILLTRQFRRLLTARFWIPAAIVLVICGPYHLLTWKMIHQGWRSDAWSIAPAIKSLPLLSRFLVESAGWPVVVVALAGFVRKTVLPLWRNSLDNYWASMTALIVSFFATHAIVFNVLSEPRYYIIVAPCVILFLVAGIEWALTARSGSLLVSRTSGADGHSSCWAARLPHPPSAFPRDHLMASPASRRSCWRPPRHRAM